MKPLAAAALIAATAILTACSGESPSSPTGSDSPSTATTHVTVTPTAPITTPVRPKPSASVVDAVRSALDTSSKHACEGSRADFLYGIDFPDDVAGNETSATGAKLAQKYGALAVTAASEKVCATVK